MYKFNNFFSKLIKDLIINEGKSAFFKGLGARLL